MKSLKDISLPVTEQQYRQDGAMHYSHIAGFDRGGFHSIKTLFDKKETPSLIFGSLVDCLMTGNPEELEQNYLITDFNFDVSGPLINATKGLFNTYNAAYQTLEDIPDDIVIATLNELDYGKTWYANTRISKLRAAGSEYYKLMFISKDKTIISSSTYAEAMDCVKALHESSVTKHLFAANNPFEPEIERCYQLKFSDTFDGIKYSCMAD